MGRTGFPHLTMGHSIQSTATKNLQFKSLAIIDILAAVVSMLLSITLALQGYGVFSLIYGGLAQCAIVAIALIFLGWQQKLLPSFYFSYAAVKPYLSFGFHLLGSNILNYFNSRVDQLVIGALLGTQALGYYSMAFKLVLQPVARINPILTKVAFPILSKVQDDKTRLKRGYFRMLDLLASINTPLLFGIAAVAPLLIPVLLGDQWLPVIPLIQVLALYSLIRSSGNAGGSLILACGRANLAFKWNLILFAFIPLAVIAGAKFGGLQGIAWTLLGLQLFLFFAWYYFVVRQLIGQCFSGYVGSISSPILLAALMSGLIISIAPLLSTLPATMQLSLQILAGGSIYVGLNVFFRNQFIKEQLQLFFKR